jgi:hypothetical protein
MSYDSWQRGENNAELSPLRTVKAYSGGDAALAAGHKLTCDSWGAEEECSSCAYFLHVHAQCADSATVVSVTFLRAALPGK